MNRTTYATLIPKRPYCVDQIGRILLIKSANKAIEMRHIQPNLPERKQWLLFDIDDEDAWFAVERSGVPKPTYIAINRQNGKAHVGYLLESPVSFFDAGTQKPIRFLRDIERGFTRRLKADLAYNAHMSKNPVHGHWETDWQAIRPYRLDELNDSLDRKDKKWVPRLSEIDTPTGRNCCIFENMRKVAYKTVLKAKKEGKLIESFREELIERGLAINGTFPFGLSYLEVAGIAKSVAKWTWKNFTVEKFSAIQSCRSRSRWQGIVTEASTKPWEAQGISRRTYYARKAAIP